MRRYAALCVLFILTFPFTVVSKIVVRTQADLSSLPNVLNNAIKSGTDKIVIKFSPGTYYYSQSMVSLSIQNDDLSLSFIGKDVTLVPVHSVTKLYNPDCIQFQGDNIVNSWSEVVQSLELISVVDETTKLCRIRIANEIRADAGDYIQVSQWYKTQQYKVVSSDADYVYFIVDDLAFINDKSEWNVNYDYIYAKKFPRYRVFSVDSNKDIQQSFITTFIDISHAKIKDVTIKGISFKGSAGSIYSKGVINLSNVSAEIIDVENCQFTECRSSCIKLENTSNLKVKDCEFYRNYTTCVSVGVNCNYALIAKNIFEDNGKEWNNGHVVLAKGADFLISDNVFCNFCYGAIGVGIWYKNKKTTKVSGVIVNNEIYYTEEYCKDYLKHTLMDSGAIYLWTQMDDVTIQGNFIHDISGVVDNRGIFCDDGAMNVQIFDNLILRVCNSYGIDLRDGAHVKDYVSKYNTGNICERNITDSEIRFYIKDESCEVINNYKFNQKGYREMPAYKQWKYRLK